FRLSLRDETERRQTRHSCSIQNQTTFQAPSGAEYAAPTGLGNWVARMTTKISLLTELQLIWPWLFHHLYQPLFGTIDKLPPYLVERLCLLVADCQDSSSKAS